MFKIKAAGFPKANVSLLIWEIISQINKEITMKTYKVFALAIVFAMLLVTGVASASNFSYMYPVIFIHGLGSSPKTWDNLVNELEDDGHWYGGTYKNSRSNLSAGEFYTVDLGDTANVTFDELGERVADAVEEIRDMTGARKVILVGHSLGGLASRAYLNTHPGDVAALITIGSPHGGSYLGYAEDYLSDIKAEEDRDKGVYFVCYVLKKGICTGDTSDYLKPDSRELRELNSVYPPKDVLYVSVIGTAEGGNSPGYENDIKAKFSASYAETFAKYYSDRNVSLCSTNVLVNWSDNVVPVCSQYLFSLFPAKDYDHYEFYLEDIDHSDQTDSDEGIQLIIDAIEYVFNNL